MSLIFRRSNASITDIVVVVTNFWGFLHKIKENVRRKQKKKNQWEKDTKASKKWSKTGWKGSKVKRLKFDNIFFTN
jgi:hypothetical protein